RSTLLPYTTLFRSSRLRPDGARHPLRGYPAPTGEVGGTSLPGGAASFRATATAGPGGEATNGYVAVAPRVLRSGQTEALSLALFTGERPAKGTVKAELLKDGRTVAEGSGLISGRGS